MQRAPLRMSLFFVCLFTVLYVFCLSLLLMSLLVSSTQSELHLELVQVIMRHGDRTPSIKEANSKYMHQTSDYEPWGLGQLTNDGKMTEYQIGIMLRQRYNQFLGSLYHPQDVYAISTDVDRAKMSLQLTLAGLYPPQEIQQWNPDLKWLAIPTYYIPEKVDIVMRPYQCPSYIVALEEVKNMIEIRDKIAHYHDFFEYLGKKTGLTFTEPLHVYDFYHGLIAQKTMNLSLPEWCTDEMFQKMQELVLLEYDIRSYTPQLKRLNGGFLVKKFIDNMNPKGNPSNKPSRKIYIYSGHEMNIVAHAKFHNMTEPKIPDYGSALIVEKLRDANSNFYVRMVYWTGVTQKLITMKLKYCDEICPMETYLELTRHMMPTDKETNCLWNNIIKEEVLQLYSEEQVVAY